MSGGEQQRVAIGRALVTDPAVVLADEPTGNLDSANSSAVCELLRDLSAVHGKTIVMVTHEPTVAVYAQEVAVLKDGKLVNRFSTKDTPDAEALGLRYQDCVPVAPTGCPRCGSALPKNAVFCHKCGLKLDTAEEGEKPLMNTDVGDGGNPKPETRMTNK